MQHFIRARLERAESIAPLRMSTTSQSHLIREPNELVTMPYPLEKRDR